MDRICCDESLIRVNGIFHIEVIKCPILPTDGDLRNCSNSKGKKDIMITCSFCSRSEVGLLIRGESRGLCTAYICNDCTEICNEIINNWKDNPSAFVNKGEEVEKKSD